MERLQKKCFFASTAMHLLLLALLVVSPAFVAPEKKLEDLPILTVIPSKLVDDPFSGGGTPNPAPPPPPQKVEPDPPKPAPPQKEIVQPKPVPPRPEPEPVKTTPKKPVETKVPDKPEPAQKETPKPPKPKRKIVPSFKPSSDTSSQREQERKEREEAVQRARKITEERNRILQSAASSLSTSTRIEQVGPGGAPFANYAQAVKSIYERAWDPPAELDDNLETVRVEVVIARSGKVMKAVIKKRSGNAALDRSIERVLQIREIAPFPEGTRDLQRTFIIDFNLKAKRFSG